MPLSYQPRTHLTDPDWFYGRSKELSDLFSYLNKPTPQNVQIVGQRRIGKSWLLQVVSLDPALRAKYLSEPDKYTFIYWDLQREIKLAPDVFLKRLLELVLIYLPGELRAECQTFAQQEDNDEALWEVFELLEADDHRVVLLLDEFAAITRNKAFAEDFFSHLRSLFGRSPLTCVTASYLSLGEMCHLGPDSPFFNIFTRIQLELLNQEEAVGFVRDPLEAHNIKVESDAIKGILRLTGPHPCFISQLCHGLMHETLKAGIITKEDVELQNGPFQASVWDDFGYYWQRLSEVEQSLLREIADGNQPKSLENPVFLCLERLSLVRRDKGAVVPFSIPFSQYVKDTKGTDVYFEKAFSDPEFNGASFMLMAENLLNASLRIHNNMREDLLAAIRAMQGRPQEAMRTCGRDVLPPLMDMVYQAEFRITPAGKQIDICREFDTKAEARQFPRHLAAHFHLLRISGNDGSHAEDYLEACTPARAFLTVLETIHLAEEVYKRYP